MDILYTSDGRKFEGMTQETVQGLLDEQGIACTFVEKGVFDSFIASKEVEREANKVPSDPIKQKNDWQIEKAKGTNAALSFIAKQLGLE